MYLELGRLHSFPTIRIGAELGLFWRTLVRWRAQDAGTVLVRVQVAADAPVQSNPFTLDV